MIISIIIAKMAEKVLKICKRGATTLPGRIALFLKRNEGGVNGAGWSSARSFEERTGGGEKL